MLKPTEELRQLREQLRSMDQHLLEALHLRFEHAKKIGAFKKKNKIAIEDLNREAENKSHNIKLMDGQLKKEIVTEFTDFLIRWSKDIQAESTN